MGQLLGALNVKTLKFYSGTEIQNTPGPNETNRNICKIISSSDGEHPRGYLELIGTKKF